MVLAAAKFFTPGFMPTPEQEAAFFSSLRLGNGVFKTTADRRLDDLNALMFGEWAKTGFRPSRVLDVGVSSGVSSVEWIEALRAAGFDASMLATDLSLHGYLLQLAPLYRVLADAAYAPLQHAIFGVPLRPWRRRIDYLTGMAVVSAALNTLFGALRRRAAASGQGVLLVSRRAQDNPHLEFAQEDILAPPSADRRFDAIRAANILNLEYFAEPQLRSAVAGLKQRLAGAGSYLAINRTHQDGSNRGSLFRLGEDGRFRCVARLGDGSEIERLVLRG
ncbi:MAG TPA: class I SAM-dependent methyltransferase [Stellaceae bacterium]|nr:class I SAM-dependent methyltransferase [Stellaceae bacterium]